ncbi:MAG: hypothetical protein DRN81_05130 [Thermoproteota archaeon]|nr:MAG: hypothetical protein DRN81_05130 [Candidatus Korarchaeota archaeon]
MGPQQIGGHGRSRGEAGGVERSEVRKSAGPAASRGARHPRPDYDSGAGSVDPLAPAGGPAGR